MMLRGAIIGLGNVAVHGHLPGWLARGDVDLVAVTDADPTRREECRSRLPKARWYESASQLLDDVDVDFVDICTPPSSHAGLIRDALARGRHVLCEKPLVGSRAALTELTEGAERARRIVHTVHNWHHAPIVRSTRELIGEGAIGRVTHATWRTLRMRPAAVAGDADNWRLDPRIAGGGILTDHGWHVFYLLSRFIGAAPIAVSASLETRRHTRWPVEDTATLRLSFEEATAEVLLTWAADERRNWARLAGTAGTIELVDDTLVLNGRGPERRWSFASGLSDGSHHPEWFHAVADEFVEAIGGDPDAGNLAEASMCVAVESLARESSRRGGETLCLGAGSPRPAG